MHFGHYSCEITKYESSSFDFQNWLSFSVFFAFPHSFQDDSPMSMKMSAEPLVEMFTRSSIDWLWKKLLF